MLLYFTDCVFSSTDSVCIISFVWHIQQTSSLLKPLIQRPTNLDFLFHCADTIAWMRHRCNLSQQVQLEPLFHHVYTTIHDSHFTAVWTGCGGELLPKRSSHCLATGRAWLIFLSSSIFHGLKIVSPQWWVCPGTTYWYFYALTTYSSLILMWACSSGILLKPLKVTTPWSTPSFSHDCNVMQCCIEKSI